MLKFTVLIDLSTMMVCTLQLKMKKVFYNKYHLKGEKVLFGESSIFGQSFGKLTDYDDSARIVVSNQNLSISHHNFHPTRLWFLLLPLSNRVKVDLDRPGQIVNWLIQIQLQCTLEGDRPV